jgi:SAM-dependent methyltransferase
VPRPRSAAATAVRRGWTSRGGREPESFDRLAAHYDRLSYLVGQALLDYLVARLPNSGGRAVDLGCGTGRHAAVLARRYADVLAVDVSAPMLAVAERHRAAGNICYQHRDLLDVEAGRDGTFDLVFSAYALHHVEALPRALGQIRALVRPGGKAILVDLCDVPREPVWFRTEARRALVADVVRRRRRTGEALEVYRLSTEPAWLEHQAADRPLPPRVFEAVYAAAFPGAEFTPLYRARALHWRARRGAAPG